MNTKFFKYLLLVAIVVIFIIIFIFRIQADENNFGNNKANTYVPNKTEQSYIYKHNTVKIYVEKELVYLVGDGESGYLEDYIGSILKPEGMKAQIVTDNTRKTDNDDSEMHVADCRLVVVTEKVRNSKHRESYTTPLFRVEGAMFVREDLSGKKPLSGVVVKGRLDDKKLTSIKYRNRALEYITADTSEEAVRIAEKKNLDFIIGDKGSIINELKSDGSYMQYAANSYQMQEENLYDYNTCIMIDSSSEVLYSILNQSIHGADRHSLSYAASEKWMNGNGPVYMKDSYDNIYILVLIIFGAVLVAFFIYYLLNKNMYEELNVRMKELTASQKELKTTFNGVRYLLAELNLQGDIIDTNRAFYEYFGARTLKKKIWDVIHLNESNFDLFKGKVLATARGASGESLEIPVEKKVFVVDVFPIENGGGVIEKLLYVAMDVTSERMAERQILQDNKMIAVGQLAAGVAHEIRNPLGIIRNYCYVLKNMDDIESHGKAIEQIEKAVEKSGAIINNLLNFSRVSLGMKEVVDIEKHIYSILTLNESLFKQKQISIEVTCDSPVKAHIEREPFDMIMMNLVSNAVEAMDKGGTIDIDIAKATDTFEISVTDEGKGIDEALIEEIFNPFFTTKGDQGGTGLGLYLVYNETEKLGGTIKVDSKPEIGSTFTIILPLDIDAKSGREDDR